jgi:bifunctional enzyme CysN/CysC
VSSEAAFVNEPLRVVIVGHVDHGKSTFIGRLLHDSGALPDGKYEQLQQVAARRGVRFEWANLMDALQAERDQNITIDTSQIWFKTARRQYVLIDAPGHREFLKNMVTGAATADAALLVIDAHEGVQEQSRRHGYLLELLGVRQIAVLVNKMDLCGFDEGAFAAIADEYGTFLAALGVEPLAFVPIAAATGDNVVSHSAAMSWWTGPTVVELMDGLSPPRRLDHLPLRFPVQDVYRFDDRRILAGRVESGTLRVGDSLLFCPGGRRSTVKTIERWNAPASDRAGAGESVGITLGEQVFVERGAIAALELSPPYQLPRFKARVFWLGHEPLRRGRAYRLKLATQDVECEIEQIERLVNASTLESIPLSTDSSVGRHEVAELWLRAKQALAFDVHSEITTTGRFVIVDGADVSGGGIVLDDAYPRMSSDVLQKGGHIFWSTGKISASQREIRNGHGGCVVWLTGLPGSGKSTIAIEAERELFRLGRHVYVLDGDNIRHGLCSDLGFSATDRAENIRRVGEVAKLFADAGVVVLTAFISPSRATRDAVRSIMPAGRFVEVYVDAPLQVCEQRDPKGLYAKARAGEIQDFTGVSAKYEAPLRPELEIRTDLLTIAESVAVLLEHLQTLEAERMRGLSPDGQP